MPVVKASPADAGCWIDGHWGQYGTARQIVIAGDYGYPNAEVVALAQKKLATIGPNVNNNPELTDDEEEELYWRSDEVDDWLNENVAPKGFSFGWHDGEFFLGSDEWWDEV